MAKAKIGGLRSIVHGRVGADIYQIGRSGAGTKQQIVRSMPEEVANPQSITQMQQRMILATVAAAFKLLKPIINHSFDGVAAGIASISAFRKMNFPILRDYVLNDATEGYQFSLNEWQERAALCGAYVVANGTKRFSSAMGGHWQIDPGTSNIMLDLTVSAPVTNHNVLLTDFKNAWQVGPDGLVTVVGIVATGEHTSRLGYYQLRFKPNLADDMVIATFPNSGDEPTSKFEISDIFDIDANVNPYSYVYCVLNDGGETATIGIKLEGVQDDDFQGGSFGLVGAWKTAKGYVHNFARLDCSLTGSAHYRDNAQVLATYPVGQTPFLNGGDEYPHVEPITPEPPAPVYPNKFTTLVADDDDILDESAVSNMYAAGQAINYEGVQLNGCTLVILDDDHQVGDEYDISSVSANQKRALTADSGHLGNVNFLTNSGRVYLWKDGVIIGRYGKGLRTDAPAINPVLTKLTCNGQNVLPENSSANASSGYPSISWEGTQIKGAWIIMSATNYQVGDDCDPTTIASSNRMYLKHNSGSSTSMYWNGTQMRFYVVNNNKIVSRCGDIYHLDSD